MIIIIWSFSSLISTTSIPMLSKWWCFGICRALVKGVPHFLHLRYGVLNFKLSFNTTSRRRSALLSTPVWNYRNIPYRTEWIEYPDIESLSKNLVSNLPEKSQTEYPFTHFLRFWITTLPLARTSLIIPVPHSQHFSTWNKISSACFPNFIWRETRFCAIL